MDSLYKISIKKLLSILFNFYVILLIFDPMRESLDFGALNSLISLLRDLLILGLFLLTIFYVPNKRASYLLTFLLLSLFGLVVLSFFSGENVGSIINCAYGVLRAYLLIFVVMNLEKFYVFTIEYLMKYFILITLMNFFFTLFIYFFMSSLITKRSFGIRICIGNPSMQSIIFLSSFCLTFYYFPFKRKLLNYLVSSLLLIAVMATVTTTAYIALFVVMVITITDKKHSFFWMICILLGGIAIFSIISFFNINIKSFTGLMEAKYNELLLKINEVFGTNFDAYTEYHSISIRDEQIKRFLDARTKESFLFGDGIFSMIDQKKYMIENTYVALFRDFGFWGILNFVVFLGYYGIKGIINFRKKRSYGILLAISIIAVYSYTLYIFAGTSTLVQIFLFFYLSIYSDKKLIANGI